MLKIISNASKIALFTFIWIAFGANLNNFAQTVPVSLQDILINAEKQTQNYRETFKNLVAEETKIFEDFNKKGEVKKKRTVESNLLIYQSMKDESRAVEYRNVMRVDGKEIGDVNERTQDFFEKVIKSESVSKELDRINDESSRYDKTLSVDGITLNQSPILAEYARPFFTFKLLGQEKIGEREVILIEYQQTSKSPFVLLNDDKIKDGKLRLSFTFNLPDSIKEPNERLRGKLWLDAETFQIWREERELTIQPNGQEKPLPIIQTTFVYQKAEKMPILVPQQILFTTFQLKAKEKGTIIESFRDLKLTLDYTKFEAPNVEIKSGEVDSTKVKSN